MRVKGKVAIVTGASMGIGADTALKLASHGATVYAAARSEDKLAALAAQNPLIKPVVADLTRAEDRAHLVAEAGEVDILVNNAGLATYGLVESQSEEVVCHMFELNVMSLIDMTQRVLPSMLSNKRGHVCNVGSSISFFAIPPMTVYAATKFAVEGFTDGLRREVLGRGVHVSLIQPGPVKTAFWDRAQSGDRPDVDPSRGMGVPAEWVSNAIYRAIKFERIPGFSSIAVPRALGLGRVAGLPGISLGLDVATALTPKAPMAQVNPEKK